MDTKNNRKSQLSAINNFIVGNSELDTVNDKLAQFNVFDVLGISNYEIRHSNTLAWLFDPLGHHGFGFKFFQRFISRMIRDSDFVGSIQAADIELASYSDLQILREWRNIDLLIWSDSNDLVVIIENKIRARESKGQLARYFNVVKEEWNSVTILPVFLTIDGEDPSDEAIDLGYQSAPMSLVLEIVENLQQRFLSSQSDETKGFINNYIHLLKRLTMQDEELTQLCKNIYRKHRAAIELIVSYGASSRLNEACIDALVDLGVTSANGSVVQEARSKVFFLPRSIVEKTQTVVLQRWEYLDIKLPFYCWFKKASKGDMLQLTFEIGPVKDFELRTKIVKVFSSGGFKVTSKALVEGTLYSRAYTKRVLILDAIESDREFESLKDIAKRMYSELEKKLEERIPSIERIFQHDAD